MSEVWSAFRYAHVLVTYSICIGNVTFFFFTFKHIKSVPFISAAALVQRSKYLSESE